MKKHNVPIKNYVFRFVPQSDNGERNVVMQMGRISTGMG